MIRRIIKINEQKCNGCELCVKACHEDAIGIVNGKATLLRDDYCDGLGDCLPNCPTGAISFEEREALEYNEAEVKKNMALKKEINEKNQADNKPEAHKEDLPCGCPGSHAKSIKRAAVVSKQTETVKQPDCCDMESQLSQWPVQIKLVPTNAAYFNNADLLIAADCTAFAYANFHNKFIKNKVTLIGCPKLDEGNYADKLTQIIKNNNIKSVTVVRMEVPCCGGIVNAVVEALRNSGKMIPWQITVITTDGKIVE
jgi:Fe-S-cluster-containing hydrogenase component 2